MASETILHGVPFSGKVVRNELTCYNQNISRNLNAVKQP